MWTCHNKWTKEEAKAVTATIPTAGNNILVRPNLSASRPIRKAPGIHPMNKMDWARVAYTSFPHIRSH